MRPLALVALPLLSFAAPQRIAVLEFRDRAQLSDFELETITDMVRGASLKLPPERFFVLTRENILESLPPGVDLDTCEGACEVETGRKLGADLVVTGDVGRFGKRLVVRMKVHDTKSGRLMASENASAASLDELGSPIETAARKMFATWSDGPSAPGAAKADVPRGRASPQRPSEPRAVTVARGRRERWDALQTATRERGLARAERLALVDAYLAREEASSPFRADAEALRVAIDAGPNLLATDGFHLDYVLPAGVRIEAGRYRWPTFQLAVFQASFSFTNFAMITTEDLGGTQILDDYARVGFGFVGLGAKRHFGERGRHEVGFLAWPLSFTWAVTECKEGEVGESSSSNSGVRTSERGDAGCNFQLGMLETQVYYRRNWGGLLTEVGLAFNPVWFGATPDVDTRTGDVLEGSHGFFESYPSVQLYGGFGY